MKALSIFTAVVLLASGSLANASVREDLQLQELNRRAEEVLSQAKACVGETQIAQWYFSASRTCPSLRSELDSFQRSVFSYLASSEVSVEPLAQAQVFASTTRFSSLQEAHQDAKYRDRAELAHRHRYDYERQMEPKDRIVLNPLLAQEIFRNYVLTFRSGEWNAQYYFTLYCAVDPLRTCPVSPEEQGGRYFHNDGSLSVGVRADYVRVFLSAVKILRELDPEVQAGHFLAISDVYEYHWNVENSSAGIIPYWSDTDATRLAHFAGPRFVISQQWPLDFNLLRAYVNEFHDNFTYRADKANEGRVLSKSTASTRLYFPQVIAKMKAAGVAASSLPEPTLECPRGKKHRCFLELPVEVGEK